LIGLRTGYLNPVVCRLPSRRGRARATFEVAPVKSARWHGCIWAIVSRLAERARDTWHPGPDYSSLQDAQTATC
jgi:hypothetical protein